MATCIYRGGIEKTTAITHEAVLAVGVSSAKPGTLLALDADQKFRLAIGADANGVVLYALGEQFGDSIDTEYNAGDYVRAYELRAGHLYAVRSASSVQKTNDGPLSIAGGAVTSPSVPGDETTRLFIDIPTSATLGQVQAATVQGELLPVKYI